MSRVAKAPVSFPAEVNITITPADIVVVGPKGTLTQAYNQLVNVSISTSNDHQLIFQPANNDPTAWAQSGTLRAIVNNMVKGVTVGFDKTLELVGVGYRAQAKPGGVSLSLGFSHSVEYAIPEGVSVETPNNTTIILRGINKQQVGQVASEIRAFRPPEPYKGKGVKYAGEVIILKEAKKK